MHPLLATLSDAAEGRFPPADGVVDVLPPDAAGAWAVVELTGHACVLSAREPDEVRRRAGDGYGGASQPDFVRWLAGPGGWIGSHDVVLVARGRGGGTLPRRDDLDDHPRVRRSRRHRQDVTVHGDETGFVTIGRGLVGRRELSVELLEGTVAGRGAGRRLIEAGLALVPPGEPVWGQVAPGNAASLRAFLAGGFRPVGAEILVESG